MAKPTPIKGLSARTKLAEAARLLAAARFADARRHMEQVARDAEVEAVHDLRVSVRRLRAALDLCGRAVQAHEREAKRLQDALGAVRDAQLQIGWLGEALLSSPERGPQRDALAALIERRQDELLRAQKALARALSRFREGEPRLLGSLEQVARRGALGGHRVRRRLRRRLRKVRQRMRAAGGSLEPDVAHALRIGVKKLRYDAELAEPALPAAKAILAAVEPLQGLLGELHDADVRLQFLEHAERLEPGKAAVPPLRIVELSRRGQLAHALAERLSQWQQEGLLAALRGRLR